MAGAGLVVAVVLAAVMYVALPWGEACQVCYTDFWHFLSAAHALRAGENPYDVEAVQAHWVGATPLAFYWIAYPPYVLSAFQPLTWVSPPAAERVWTLVNLAALAGIGTLVLGVLRVRITGPRLGLTLLFTLFYLPTLAVLSLGQFTILLVAASYLAWWLLQQGRFGPAGLALAALTIKPPLLVIPLLHLAVIRQWRALGAFSAAAAVLLLPGWPLLGSWYQGVRDLTAYQHVNRSWANPSPLALMEYLGLGDPLLRIAAAGGLSLAQLGGFVLLARRAAKPGEPLSPYDDLVLALGWTLLPLVLPQFRAYDLMILVAPMLVIGRAHLLRGGLSGWAGCGLVGLAWAWPYLQLLLGSLVSGFSTTWVWYLISPLALCAAGLLALWRLPRKWEEIVICAKRWRVRAEQQGWALSRSARLGCAEARGYFPAVVIDPKRPGEQRRVGADVVARQRQNHSEMKDIVLVEVPDRRE